MSTLQINRDSLLKLTHESAEIRLRTLEQITGKLERAIELNSIQVDFKPVELCKQLIRWFGFSPIRAPLKVLNVLKGILQSPIYGEKVIKRMGAERLRKEFRKIKILLENERQEIIVVQEILHYLKTCEQAALEKKQENDELEDLMKATNNLGLQEVVRLEEGEEYNLDDYEIPWSSPSTSDYTSMKLMSDILRNSQATPDEVQHALQHLQLTMKDYPAEYLLQAPHIFRKLLKVFEEQDKIDTRKCPLDLIAGALYEFLNILEAGLKFRRKSSSFPFSTITYDVTLATPSQLRVEKALAELLEVCLYHLDLMAEQNSASSVVWEIIFKISRLHGLLKRQIDDIYLQKLARIIRRLCLKYTESEQCTRLRLYQMQLIFLLQDMAQYNVLLKPLKSTDVFEPILRDYSLKCLYPDRHLQLQNALWTTEPSLQEKYQLLRKYEQTLRQAIGMLMGASVGAADLVKSSKEIIAILEKLQSKHLLDIILKSLLDALPLYISNDNLKEEAIRLFINMLNISFMPLKTYIYQKLTAVFKRHIGCLMNGESYLSVCSNASLLAAGIIGIPWNTHLLLHIIHDGFESSDEIIQNCCFTILELLLQSQSLFGSKWSTFLPILVPALPLLCCCSTSKKIMDLLLKLYDPDSRLLPYVSVLQGNISFLFHSKAEKRSEALTRLLYTLNSLNGSDKYMPNLLHISDTLPNDICLLTAPREYRHIFNDISVMRSDAVSSLNNLFQLLDSPDVEPLIRKTTLMQINVLCSNWDMTAELCNAGASFLILQALENALQNSSCIDYPDAAIPAISILNKILLYDSSLRCELSETPNIYVLLLRALMMFHHDIQARQDATMCLFQLLFAHQLVVTEKNIEGPLILGNIHMPIDVYLRSALISYGEDVDLQKITSLFASTQEEMQYWRFLIADVSCDGLAKINQKSLAKQIQLDVREDLKLTNQDVKLIRATQPCVSLQRLVKAASNATDHGSLIQACSVLKQQLLLPRLKGTFLVDMESTHTLCSMLNKYLQLQPSNSNDLELYGHLLDVLNNCLRIPLIHIASEFMKILHKDVRHAFITMITQSQEIPVKNYSQICSLLEYLIGMQGEMLENSLSASECSTFFSNLFDLLMERCLQLFEVRDLQRVRCLLSLMLALSSRHLDMPDKLLFYYCRRFIQLSLALKSFNQTGSQWHRDCLKSVLQLAQQMENAKQNFRLTSGVVKYISGLCAHIDGHVRILAWSILYLTSETEAVLPSETDKEAKISNCSGTELLLGELSYLPGGFMACCLSTLLDFNEIISVRQIAGQLFANLIQRQGDIDHLEQLLEQHSFVRSAGEVLNKDICILSNRIPEEFINSNTSQLTTCELISAYTRICLEMSLRSSKFLDEICTRSFMFKLYEILKHPLPPDSFNLDAYIDMTALVCRLYASCYANNFVFLQRTICRDPVWLDCYCKILFKCMPITWEPFKIVDMLQLLMVLLKDPTALEQLMTKMIDYSSEIVKLFQYAFAVARLNTVLQRCMLSLLSLICIKAQPEVGGELSCNVLLLINGSNITKNGDVEHIADIEAENKENKNNNNAKRKSKNSEKETKGR